MMSLSNSSIEGLEEKLKRMKSELAPESLDFKYSDIHKTKIEATYKVAL